MIVTLSDYIMEQEVSDATCEDIALEQALAEINVASSLVNAYSKQIFMLEYASEYVQEGETKTELKTIWGNKDTNFFKKLWESFKAICAGIGRLFTGLIDKIRNRKGKADAAVKALEAAKNLPQEDQQKVVRVIEDALSKVRDGDADISITGYSFEDYKKLNDNITIRSKKFIEAVNAVYEALENISALDVDETTGGLNNAARTKIDKLLADVDKRDELKHRAHQSQAIGNPEILKKTEQTLDKYIASIKYFRDTLIPNWTETSKEVANTVKSIANIKIDELDILKTGPKTEVELDGEKVSGQTRSFSNGASELNKFIAGVNSRITTASQKLSTEIKNMAEYMDRLTTAALQATSKTRQDFYTKKASDITKNAKPGPDLSDTDEHAE